MPEILAAYERDGLQYGAVRILLEAKPIALEFCVDQAGYGALRKVLQSKPFAVTPGVSHRYFFSGGVARQKLGGQTATFGIRIESQGSAKTFNFSGPESLVANLIWFASLKEHTEVAHLKPFTQID